MDVAEPWLPELLSFSTPSPSQGLVSSVSGADVPAFDSASGVEGLISLAAIPCPGFRPQECIEGKAWKPTSCFRIFPQPPSMGIFLIIREL